MNDFYTPVILTDSSLHFFVAWELSKTLSASEHIRIQVYGYTKWERHSFLPPLTSSPQTPRYVEAFWAVNNLPWGKMGWPTWVSRTPLTLESLWGWCQLVIQRRSSSALSVVGPPWWSTGPVTCHYNFLPRDPHMELSSLRCVIRIFSPSALWWL